jgi:transcriptional regulator with XRE-family HTH domain
MTPNDALRASMLRLRKERGWTRAQLAARWGLSEAVAGHLENASRGREFTVNEAMSLAAVFGVPLAEMMPPPDCPVCQDNPRPRTACLECGAEGKPADGGA